MNGSGGSIGGSNIFGKSQSLQCAPPTGSGIHIDENVKGNGCYEKNYFLFFFAFKNFSVAANGFTETYYMSNFCWEHMFDYPAKEFTLRQNESG